MKRGTFSLLRDSQSARFFSRTQHTATGPLSALSSSGLSRRSGLICATSYESNSVPFSSHPFFSDPLLHLIRSAKDF